MGDWGCWGGGGAESTGSDTDPGQQRQAKGERILCNLNRKPNVRGCVL